MSYQKLSERGFSDGQIETFVACITRRIGHQVVADGKYSEFVIKESNARKLILKIMVGKTRTDSVRFAFNVWTGAEEKLKLRAYLQDKGAANWSFKCDEIALMPTFKKGRNPEVGNVMSFNPIADANKPLHFSVEDLCNNRENLATLAHDVLKRLEDVDYFAADCRQWMESKPPNT